MAPVTAVLPVPVAALFWLWLIVSTVILVIRLARRRAQSKEAADALPAEPVATSVPFGPRSPEAARSPIQPAEPTDDTVPTSVTAAQVTPTDGRKGFFAAPPAADAVDPRPDDVARPTVAEALTGIIMPCGLSPVVDGSVSIPNPFRVAFLTTAADAAAVGAGMGDELERLGFQLSTAAATELLARKPGVELRVVLYPTPSAARRGLDTIFPVAPDGSIGVELST